VLVAQLSPYDKFIKSCRSEVTKKAYVFVADSGNSRIQKFTNDGKFIRKWGSGCSASIDALSANPPHQIITALSGLASPFE
jgi:hypothetical protein